jgi:protein-tyrosine phosphatase
MVKVLFVCLGNICRSPMAEAIFRNILKGNGLDKEIKVDSAGLGDWHEGEPPHVGTQNILKENEIDFSRIKARQLKQNDLKEYTYIIAMDAENVGAIHRLAGYDKTGEIARLLDFVDDSKTEDVPDPYYSDNFAEVFELINNGCNHLFTYICNEQNLGNE